MRLVAGVTALSVTGSMSSTVVLGYAVQDVRTSPGGWKSVGVICKAWCVCRAHRSTVTLIYKHCAPVLRDRGVSLPTCDLCELEKGAEW